MSEDLPVNDTNNLPELSSRMSFSGEVREDVPTISGLGNGLRLLTEKKLELTHARCDEVLRLPEFYVRGMPVDRKLSNQHVTYLNTTMRNGEFHPEWVFLTTCICLEGFDNFLSGTEFRMNGQHTCWARLYMPEDYPCLVRFMKYEAKTLADMRMLYASMDRNKSRSNKNVITSLLVGTEQFEGVPGRVLTMVAAALRFWVYPAKDYLHPPDEVAYMMQTAHKDIVSKVTAYMREGAKTRTYEQTLNRSCVVAALFETFAKLPTKAHEFWDVVRIGFGEDVTGVTDPRLKLYNALKESVMGAKGITQVGHSSVRGGKRIVPPEIMYRWCIFAWNKWRRGETMTNMTTSTSDDRPRAK